MLLKRLFKILKAIEKKLYSPNNYAKKVGIKYGKNCKFLTKRFGSEPYMISIGDNVELSFDVTFITHDGALWVVRNLYKEYQNSDLIKAINIGNNVFIGAQSIILPGVTINDNIIVGAGSLINKNLEANNVYAGVPAKKICSIDEYVSKNKKDFLNIKSYSFDEKKRYLLK